MPASEEAHNSRVSHDSLALLRTAQATSKARLVYAVNHDGGRVIQETIHGRGILRDEVALQRGA